MIEKSLIVHYLKNKQIATLESWISQLQQNLLDNLLRNLRSCLWFFSLQYFIQLYRCIKKQHLRVGVSLYVVSTIIQQLNDVLYLIKSYHLG